MEGIGADARITLPRLRRVPAASSSPYPIARNAQTEGQQIVDVLREQPFGRVNVPARHAAREPGVP